MKKRIYYNRQFIRWMRFFESRLKKRFKPLPEKPFVIVSPFLSLDERNIKNSLNQNYENYRVILVNDAKEPLEINEKRVTVINNKTNRGMIFNYYQAIHMCRDDEIIVALDGDDWLAHENVLKELNQVYSNSNTLLTYGQYIEYPNYTRGACEPIPQSIKNVRDYKWVTSHLRTFYAHLFKRIEEKDLQYKGEFVKVTGDYAMMLPLIEMARYRHTFLTDILCVYNGKHPLNDHFIKPKEQKEMELYFRSLTPYAPIS